MAGARVTCCDGVVMNESIAQLDELRDGAFWDQRWAEYQPALIQASKLLIGVPIVVCALAVLVTLAVVLCPLAPFVELWRRSLQARNA
jgi:hypothetical protein